jgi:hypothetical protein
MKPFNILVFPCGSEIGLEIHRSLKYSAHVNLVGANSIDDHGMFVYENYIGDVPFVDSPGIIPALKKIVRDYQIDALYPTMDKVISKLKSFESELGCKVISSEAVTTDICVSKTKTYQVLDGKVKTPKTYASMDLVDTYPIFIKPDIGYGARGTYRADTSDDAQDFFRKNKGEYVITEYLPFEEFTVDCFTNKHGQLLFAGPRFRRRISNGISVNTQPVKDIDTSPFMKIASTINTVLKFRGAWFFQVKMDSNGNLTLLEIASRLGGSSSLFRCKGVNFALLSIFDAFDMEVSVNCNNYDIELDRALDNKYKVNVDYEVVYVDFDDCIVINGKINTNLMAFLFQAISNAKKLVLISKHDGDLTSALKKLRIENLFDEITHLRREDEKTNYILNKKSLFIDDSFAEREKVSKLGIPVFSPDMIECLRRD